MSDKPQFQVTPLRMFSNETEYNVLCETCHFKVAVGSYGTVLSCLECYEKSERPMMMIAKMRKALEQLAEWDMLQKTADGLWKQTSDGPWARQLIADALS